MNEFTYHEYRELKAFFERRGVAGADGCISALLELATGKPLGAEYILLKTGSSERLQFCDAAAAELKRNVQRLADGEPLQYITGRTDFYGYDFCVGPGVLIPRFDTEILLEKSLFFLSGGERILDLCCGSGCIGTALLLEMQKRGLECFVTFADVSEPALSFTRKNVEKFGLGRNSGILRHDVRTDAFADEFDMIVSNPPYIAAEELPCLPENVRHEPLLALDGGEDGLDFYRLIAQKYQKNLKQGGYLLFECGMGQFSDVFHIMEKNGFTDCGVCSDLGGIERAVWGRTPFWKGK